MERILCRARILIGSLTGEPRGGAPSAMPAEGVDQTINSPPVALLVMGSSGWGAMMAVTALFALCLGNGLMSEHTGALGLLYFLGGALAWSPALLAAMRLSRGKPFETRFAAFFTSLAAVTATMTAVLFALEYRSFYARWHAPFGTVVWAFQFILTGASAAYQFAVLGGRLFLPLGLPFLLAVSFYLAKHSR